MADHEIRVCSVHDAPLELRVEAVDRGTIQDKRKRLQETGACHFSNSYNPEEF